MPTCPSKRKIWKVCQLYGVWEGPYIENAPSGVIFPEWGHSSSRAFCPSNGRGHQIDVAPSRIQYVLHQRRIAGLAQQKGNTAMPDLNERLVNVSGDNAVAPTEPAPKPPLPGPTSVFSPGNHSVTMRCPMPAITQPRDPQRFAQWDRGNSVPQMQLHLPNVVKPSGNSLQPVPAPQPIQAPAQGSVSVSASPTSVASGGAVVLTVSCSGGKSVRLSGQYLNGKSGPVSLPGSPWSLPATGGTQSSGALNLPPNTSVTFTAILSGAGGGGSSLPTTVQGSCAVRIT
jgi:hypothetical protein